MKLKVTLAILLLALSAGSAFAKQPVACEKVTGCVSGGGSTTCETWIFCDDGTSYQV